MAFTRTPFDSRVLETGFNSIKHPHRSIQCGSGLSLSFRWDDSAAVLDLNSPLVEIDEHILALLCDESALCRRSNEARERITLAGVKHSPQDDLDCSMDLLDPRLVR